MRLIYKALIRLFTLFYLSKNIYVIQKMCTSVTCDNVHVKKKKNIILISVQFDMIFSNLVMNTLNQNLELLAILTFMY